MRRPHETRRGAEQALEQVSATMDALQHETSRIGEENEAMVQQIVGLTKELQEAKDSQEEARLLWRQRVQMIRDISSRVMEAAWRLGIEGLSLPPTPEDDGVILHIFGQLTDKLVEVTARVMELIDVECRELLGLAGTRIFSNLQHLRPDLDLLDVLQRRKTRTPLGTPDPHAVARAARLDIAIQRLQVIYSWPGMLAAARLESSSSKEATSSEESGDAEAMESGDEEDAPPHQAWTSMMPTAPRRTPRKLAHQSFP
jgi:hypothetical protein